MKDLVEGTADFEGARLLEILGLEPDAKPSPDAQGARGEKRCVMDEPIDRGPCVIEVVLAELEIHSSSKVG